MVDLGVPHGVVTQSLALLRWAAKKAGLYPDDADAALLVDEIMDVTSEVGNKAPQHSDAETKKKLREEYAAGPLAKYCTFLERKVKAAGGPFVAGAKMSVADISIYILTNMIATNDLDYVPATYLDAYPALLAHHAAVKNSEIVTKFA